jgi:hypothetical protein
MKTIIDKFMAKVTPEPNSGCWLFDSSWLKGGYGQFVLNKKCKQSHRLSYEFFCGSIPDGYVVMHKCDVPCCVNPDHLMVGTMQQNIDDMFKKGRNPIQKGQSNNRSYLTNEQVIAIRSENGLYKDIACKYGITPATVGKIKRRERWSHL